MFFLHSFIVALAFASPPDAACTGPLTRTKVVACATAASPRLTADREHVAASRGEADAARVVLPTNPTVSVTLGQRWNTVGDRALNVTGTVSQRIEIAGQRRKRRDVAAATVRANEHTAATTQREVIAQALSAYYDVLASRQEVLVVERGHATAGKLREVTEARASAGLGAPLHVDLAAAEVARFAEQLALARGRVRVAQARLASALGLDPAGPLPEVRGELSPLSTPAGLRQVHARVGDRPEVARGRAERQIHEGTVGLLRRARVPSPSLSVFAQTDGFNERVVGGGLSFPIPLPFPVGRTNKGKLRASRARVRESEARIDATTRTVTLQATLAYHEYTAREDAAAAYTEDARVSARDSLDALSAEIEHGRIPVRDALLTQQTLIALLLRAVESKHALCQASVALTLAAATPFDGGPR